MFSSFCVVEFSEDNSVEAISTGWIDVKNNTCKFPGDTRKLITTLRSHPKSKPAKSWPNSTVETGTENEGGSSKRKRRPRDIFSPETAIQGTSQEAEKELSGANDIGHQGKSPSRVKAIDNVISPNQSKDSTPASSLDSDDSSKILENVSRRSVSIESSISFQKAVLGELQEIRNDIEILRANSCKVTGRDECPFEILFQTEQDLRNADEQLKDRAKIVKLKNWSIAVGGKTFQRATTYVLSKLFSHELALKTSFSGRGGKICFQKLKIASSILGAISSIEDFCYSESQVETACQIWFRGVSDRCGGRARRRFKAAI
ncbi:unnamed protein product [Allacma fusca]|uniref:DUF4806 domain-containing protein n=1 Tax=Allacma fusca TaxID=39272 RepID=A0A8J2J3F1_9HEXA|nr:unnamed protein product [Allacma fusca]